MTSHSWSSCKTKPKTKQASGAGAAHVEEGLDQVKHSLAYYPPTYEQDGFTHATSDPAKLLTVANYFYQDVRADWTCLKMTRDSLAKAKMILKFEDPSPVGSKKPLTAKESGGERFPHIYGGIPTSGVVVQEYPVRRGIDGSYLSIDGLVEPSADASSAPVLLVKLLASKLFSLVPSSSAVACGMAGVALGVALSKRK